MAFQLSTGFIQEGQNGTIDENDPEDPEDDEEVGLWLHDIGSVGPGLEYYWRIDTGPVDPTTLEFDPLDDPRVLVGPDHAVSWEQLNAWGIVDATTTAVVTLKVVDDAGSVDYAQSSLEVGDISPQPTVFEFEPDETAACGGNAVVVNATLDDQNPLEEIVSVGIDWNWDIFNTEPEPEPTADEMLTVTPNIDGTFSVTGAHSYDSAGDKFPVLIVTSHNPDSGNDEEQIAFLLYDNPILTFPLISIGPTGTEFSLTSPNEEADDFEWLVTKDGDPFDPETPTDEVDFEFTPSASGVYDVTVTATTTITIGEFEFESVEVYDHTIIVTGGAASAPRRRSTAPPGSSLEGTLINLTSDVTQSSCGGAATYAWSVTKNGDLFASAATEDFSFTPDDNGAYEVTLTVTDGGGSDADVQSITVNNVDPVAEAIAGPTQGVRSQTLSFSSSVTDAGSADTHTTSWQVLDSTSAVVASGSGLSFDFTPTANGAYSVEFTVTDDDLADHTVSQALNVTTTLLQAGTLYVGGTTASDTFVFTPTSTPGQFTLQLNSVNQGAFLPTADVRIFGGAGAADAVTVNGNNVSNAFEVHADRLVLNGLPFYDLQIESRQINALGSGDAITAHGGSVTIAGGSGSDTLTAATGVSNDWTITAQNAGNLNGQILFTSIEHLVGDAAADAFHLGDGVGVNNGIDGGGGADTLDYASYTSAVTVNLQSGTASHTGGIASIENLIGGSASDTVTAPNTINTWTLSGADAGNINGAVTYAAFENLKGGTQVDTFQVQGGGSVSGNVDGGSGQDVLDYGAFGGPATVDLATSAGSGLAEFDSISSFVGSAAADTLIGKNSNNTWTVTAAGAGTVGSTTFSAFEALQGGTANDTFRVTEGVSSGLSIDGGNATTNDRLDYADYTTAVSVDLGADSATGLVSASGIENVAGGAGNDILRGNGGNNMLAGNQGNDIIIGGGGNDTINGNGGRDILIGGVGADTILGNADEDILVAGTTSHDGADMALLLLLGEWTSSNNYATRVANITNGGGLNGTTVLVGDDGGTQTVFNDTDVDTLTGNGGVDWFFANQNGTGAIDIVTDKTANELWNDTDF